MMTLYRLMSSLRGAGSAQWERLSATQQLTLRGLGVLTGVVLLAGLVGGQANRAVAASDAAMYTGTAVRSEFRKLRQTLDTTTGELELTRMKLERAEAVLDYSARYQVPGDLAGLIYDVALREGIEPELAFRLVNLESRFYPRARSSAGALGLAQVIPATARFYEPSITPERLFDPTTNLQIGFRYLRDLIEVYGDVNLALLAYNRGPTRLKNLMDAGKDPRNGYASRIMKDYPGLQ